MNEKFNKLLDVIVASIQDIETRYFNFQVANGDNPIARERVFCAELYHQMRSRFDDIDYDLNNEPNKKSHPIIEKHCGSINPDFIVHRMGSMGPNDNLAVIEVKTSRGNLTDGIDKDIQTINCMASIKNGYYGGIIIVFGRLTNRKKENLIKRIAQLKSPALKRFSIIFQSEPRTVPEIIEL